MLTKFFPPTVISVVVSYLRIYVFCLHVFLPIMSCLQDYVSGHRDLQLRSTEPPYRIHCSRCYPNKPEKTFEGTDLI